MSDETLSAMDLLSAVAPEKETKSPAKKYVTFTHEEWAKFEAFFGRRVEAPELKAFMLAIPAGKVQVGLS